jgi:exodeoxyribonuclease V alpha subunit
LLQQKGLLRIENATGTPSQWFAGRPVLVTRNDANLQLMNGDIGITLAVPVRNAEPPHLTRRVLRVAFPRSDGSNGMRWVLPSRLQAVETVFAMTVHKAQGSEFTHTALVLPDAVNPVLTQELIYTAITRSKQRFTLLYTQSSVLGEALCRRVVRSSGIANSLKRLNISTENAANV